MTSFTQFLEQRDPELYDEMNRRDFLKGAAVLGIGSTLGGIGLKKLTDLGVGGKKIEPKTKNLNCFFKVALLFLLLVKTFLYLYKAI